MKQKLFSLLLGLIVLFGSMDVTWAACWHPPVVRTIPPTKKSVVFQDHILRNTAFFESHGQGYTAVTGNWDRAGLSFGIVQFNIKNGNLQRIIKDYIRAYPGKFFQIFGTQKANVLRNVINSNCLRTQMKWADSITLKHGKRRLHSIERGWELAFHRFGADYNCIRLQRKYANIYFRMADELSSHLGIGSQQGYAFLFDQCIQQGGFRSKGKEIRKAIQNAIHRNVGFQGMSLDKKRLEICLWYIKHPLAKKRRVLIRNGHGEYYGGYYNVHQFELSYGKAAF